MPSPRRRLEGVRSKPTIGGLRVESGTQRQLPVEVELGLASLAFVTLNDANDQPCSIASSPIRRIVPSELRNHRTPSTSL